ncbi:Putative F-box/LRR-repeat protein At3g18150 [Linum perenne]
MAPATTTTTNKRIKSSTNNSEGRDHISDLPDEIIHKVLRRISSPAKAARTTALSRRWRSVWSSYPAVQYRHSDLPRSTVEKRVENFKKFVEASMERISRHSQMRMETLDISLVGKSADYSSLVKQLLIFAMERKVEEISVILRNPGLFLSMKSFITRFPQFQTVCITNLDDEHNVTFNEEETGDNTSNPASINHLKYCTIQSNSKVDKRALLKALFKVCHPNYLTLIHRHKNSERFFRGLLSLMQQKGDFHESLMWLNGLKDVKIITRDVDVVIEEEDKELMRGYSTCKTQNQLCLELTWG